MNNKGKQLIEEAKRRGYAKCNFKCLMGFDREVHENIEKWHYEQSQDRLYTMPDGDGGSVVYKDGVWAEILQPMENKRFKKGDKVIITDFGIANSRYFTLNKPYILSKDFNKDNGFYVEIDDDNHINNGWFNAFDLGIKIELYE